MSKPLLIVLEGGDKVGKSTIYQALRRATHYQPFVIDRFIGSNIVYDKMYGRTSIADNRAAELALMEKFEVILVLLDAPEEELILRIEANEEGADKAIALDNICDTKPLFKDYFLAAPYHHKILIDTTHAVDECVREITDYINEIDYRTTIVSEVLKLRDLIKRTGTRLDKFADDLNTGTCKQISWIELINQKIELEFESRTNFYGHELEGVMELLGDKFDKRNEGEFYHYKQLEYSLLHKIEETEYFFNQNLDDSRKLIVFSNDCISSIQMIFRDNTLHFLVHMRSSDVLELLPLDLLALSRIMVAVCNKHKWPDQVKLKLSVTIGSAHIYLRGGRE